METETKPAILDLEKIATRWYRRPIWVHVDGEHQVVNREELLALIREWREFRKNALSANR